MARSAGAPASRLGQRGVAGRWPGPEPEKRSATNRPRSRRCSRTVRTMASAIRTQRGSGPLAARATQHRVSIRSAGKRRGLEGGRRAIVTPKNRDRARPKHNPMPGTGHLPWPGHVGYTSAFPPLGGRCREIPVVSPGVGRGGCVGQTALPTPLKSRETQGSRRLAVWPIVFLRDTPPLTSPAGQDPFSQGACHDGRSEFRSAGPG